MLRENNCLQGAGVAGIRHSDVDRASAGDTRRHMRIATWNVNSLKARLDKVVWWLARARPAVLLMQETKLADADAPTERDAFGRLCAWGLIDAYRLHHPEPGRYTWWDYRAGNFHKNFGMRIDHLLVTRPVAGRTVWAEIDREARKGKPLPSDHAPLVIDVDQPGSPLDAGLASAEGRIAGRR